MNLAVRLHRRHLDQALAEGANAGSDPHAFEDWIENALIGRGVR